MISLVEVVGGAKTSPETIEKTMAFYASIGKKPIRLYKALPGHVANQLQAALTRRSSIHSTGCVECRRRRRRCQLRAGAAMGRIGPSLQWHLGGGAGGIHHFMEHLMDPMAGLMKALGSPNITPELKQTVTDGVMRMAANRSIEELAEEENQVLTGLLSSRASVGL